MRIVITGGAGYIGSTVASACLDAGHEVVIIDDFSTGRREFTDGRSIVEGDFADPAVWAQVAEQPVDAVVHCAAKILVPESVEKPLEYYENNVGKTIDLLEILRCHGINRILFSSSASIYATDANFQVTEESALDPQSPYATTKFMMEFILRDVSASTELKAISLRYFNPIGTDPQMRTGQQIEHPSHVLGKMLDAWIEKRPFTVTGVDWPTRDGSGIRDYIHVWDLALAHVAAIEKFDAVTARQDYQVINIGTGNGVTVKELARAFQEVSGAPLEVAEGPARPGDVAGAYTVSTKGLELLEWKPQFTEAEGVRDAIAWLPVRKEKLGY